MLKEGFLIVLVIFGLDFEIWIFFIFHVVFGLFLPHMIWV